MLPQGKNKNTSLRYYVALVLMYCRNEAVLARGSPDAGFICNTEIIVKDMELFTFHGPSVA